MDEKVKNFINDGLQEKRINTVSSLVQCELESMVNVVGVAQFLYQQNKKTGFLTLVDDPYFEKFPRAYLDIKINPKNSLFAAIVNRRLTALLNRNIFVHGRLLSKDERDGKAYYMVEPIGEVKVVL